MSTAGIIANPASGRDIRRLVAHGTVFSNDEKTHIVRRLLAGLEAAGVERVRIMPESYGIGYKALDGLETALDVSILSMPTSYTQADSTRAAALMARERVGCIATLGGDGTNRAVALGCGNIPLMPISTGTNNAFPAMIEGTIAGLAAGLVACGLAAEAVGRAPRLDIFYGEAPPGAGPPDDIALVDAAVYDERFIAARALCEAAKIKEVVSTRTTPGHIGLSSIGAHLPQATSPGQGAHLKLAPNGRPVLAPIAPGLVHQVGLAEYRPLQPGDEVLIRQPKACVLAFDGEREKELGPGAAVRLRLNEDGPRVIDPRWAIDLAARTGFFVH